jgi:serine/threonine protein kinase
MPPEQFNRETPTPRVDVYGLGATLYEMLTGHIPFKSADHAELFRRFLDGVPPPPIRERNPRVPTALAAVVELALELEAARRVPTAAALSLLLRAVAWRQGLLPDSESTRALHARCRRGGDLACMDALDAAARGEIRAALTEIGTGDALDDFDGPVTAVIRHVPTIDEEEDGVTLAGDAFPSPPDDEDDDRTVVMDGPGHRDD